MYCRYVDDAFMVFSGELDAKRFFEYLDTKHPNIKFTCELETDNTLNFLVVK